jgi:hypothetical protein
MSGSEFHNMGAATEKERPPYEIADWLKLDINM